MKTLIERLRRPVPRYRQEVAALTSMEQVYCRLAGAYAVIAALHGKAAQLAEREERGDPDYIRSQRVCTAAAQEASHVYLEGALIEHAHDHPEEKPS
jgi:hypothetical protein